jgi:hypothetical protein
MSILRCNAAFFWIAFVVAVSPLRTNAQSNETVLERYSFRTGEFSDRVTLDFVDKSLGNGTARTRIKIKGTPDGGALNLHVTRRVEPGQIVFALLVFKVEVRGLDSSGAGIYAQDFPGFTFGDSASGDWQRSLDAIPATVARLSVTFFGNYE